MHRAARRARPGCGKGPRAGPWRPTVRGPPLVAVAAVGRRPRELEITERQVGLERGPVPAPSLLVRLEVRHLPARLADLRARGVGSARGVAATMYVPRRHCSLAIWKGPAVKWVLQVRSSGPGHPEGAGSHFDRATSTTNQADYAGCPGQSRMTVVRRGLLPSRRASRPDSADLESGRPARVRSPWQRAKGWGGGAGRTTTSGDDHGDHDAGQQRTAISHHEPVPRSVPRRATRECSKSKRRNGPVRGPPPGPTRERACAAVRAAWGSPSRHVCDTVTDSLSPKLEVWVAMRILEIPVALAILVPRRPREVRRASRHAPCSLSR